MEKYVCDVCGYVYDPAEGDPDNGIAPGTPCRKIGFAPCAALARISFPRSEHKHV